MLQSLRARFGCFNVVVDAVSVCNEKASRDDANVWLTALPLTHSTFKRLCLAHCVRIASSSTLLCKSERLQLQYVAKDFFLPLLRRALWIWTGLWLYRMKCRLKKFHASQFIYFLVNALAATVKFNQLNLSFCLSICKAPRSDPSTFVSCTTSAIQIAEFSRLIWVQPSTATAISGTILNSFHSRTSRSFQTRAFIADVWLCG